MTNPEAERQTVDGIISELPGALAELTGAEAELKGAQNELLGVGLQAEGLDDDRDAAITAAARVQVKTLLGEIPRRLHTVVSHVFSPEDRLLGPPLQDVERLIELDNKLVSAAGQPVVVLKPGKSWIDIGRLKPENELGTTGLQYSHGFRDKQPGAVLPVYRSVAFDLVSGAEPTHDVVHNDDELQRRSWVSPMENDADKTRSRIDPLKTEVLLAADERKPGEADPDTVYILVGYTHLQRVLNRLLGFDAAQTEGGQEFMKFLRAKKAQERLQDAAIDFDMDFIDGYLDYRIAELQSLRQEGGPLQAMSEDYHQALLAGLTHKRDELIKAGWLSGPKPITT